MPELRRRRHGGEHHRGNRDQDNQDDETPHGTLLSLDDANGSVTSAPGELIDEFRCAPSGG